MPTGQRKQGKRDLRLNARASEDEIDAFNEACKKVRVDPADALRALASAFCEHVTEHKRITFPIQIAESPGK